MLVLCLSSRPGRRLVDVELQGTTCRDWEDIAINVEDGISYIYLADIGDNAYVRWFCRLQFSSLPGPLSPSTSLRSQRCLKTGTGRVSWSAPRISCTSIFDIRTIIVTAKPWRSIHLTGTFFFSPRTTSNMPLMCSRFPTVGATPRLWSTSPPCPTSRSPGRTSPPLETLWRWLTTGRVGAGPSPTLRHHGPTSWRLTQPPATSPSRRNLSVKPLPSQTGEIL